MNEDYRLFILWASADREVAIETVFMFALNSHKHHWFRDVEICIWGPSARLAVEDEEVNVRLSNIIGNGLKVTACKACTDHMGVSEELERMGVEVIHMGQPLAGLLRSDVKVLSL